MSLSFRFFGLSFLVSSSIRLFVSQFRRSPPLFHFLTLTNSLPSSSSVIPPSIPLPSPPRLPLPFHCVYCMFPSLPEFEPSLPSDCTSNVRSHHVSVSILPAVVALTHRYLPSMKKEEGLTVGDVNQREREKREEK